LPTTTSAIENVSDTARWVAVYRAMETERPDAHFRDPWARRLAGEKGEAIMQGMRRGRQVAWAMIVRTAVFDQVILELVRERGVDMVVNLAAGLDTRAWRLDLPPSLRWVDVDLPGILHYKTGLMEGEQPRCRYEAVAADLTDPAVRGELLARLGGEARKALVVAEGLLIYLTPENVGSLAAALHAQPSFQWWLLDLASPRLLKWMQKSWGKSVHGGNAPFLFAPAEGSAFFERFGWREARWYGTQDEARRLKRQMPGVWIWRLMMLVSTRKRREEMRRFAGYLLLERT
jgi:methyltransferase (TIGR00027 family)